MNPLAAPLSLAVVLTALALVALGVVVTILVLANAPSSRYVAGDA